ncbi:ParB/Sulfiredoxin [Yarrowia lipolytica]|uniref:Sulfiredoxin n=2 Tax=Yarrowia lipolytica TaxID=4952 RepID=Q6C8V4_YARLI|nr:YALI0D16709p [Yarrowia lipolytica CLIB122]RDW24656.1 ParB/Sulfiredoxin [Yarrowia lipolytica]RDW30880.1 ParB/Sulfiredoxin [Yarrowia lipolytica]RDW38853.1 ParB/Sulfiredoxin [Yarrowia lipolytica]RDW44682.1 ParB/Sulfiredoxin [Yarrowia lipolytica]RDW55070.1 ParB/Sulfiredoxin [Yarrowia lipolytica]|eukprot:XP_502908.1 YALI0D16709p [Yarrowia lipolytica CLIB122]
MSMQTTLAKTEYLPLKEVSRPIPPVLDEEKISKMIETLKAHEHKSSESDESALPPPDVLVIRRNGKTHYFAFGGCHRFQAYDRLNTDKILCRLIPCTVDQLKLYLGSSAETLLERI